MAHVGEELQLGIRGIFLHLALLHDLPVGEDNKQEAQANQGTKRNHQQLLIAVQCEVSIYFLVQLRKSIAQRAHFLRLQHRHIGILLRHQRRTQEVLTLVRFTFQNIHRQLHHQVATGRINIRSNEHTPLNQFYAAILAWQGIHTHIKNAILQSVALHRLVGT